MEAALWKLYEEGTPDDEVAVIIRLADPLTVPDGVRIIARFGLIATCRLRRGDIPNVRQQSPVRSMKKAQLYDHNPVEEQTGDITEDGSPEEADDPMAQPGDQRRPEGIRYTGKGVVVAHIDWGIDFAHPEFRKADGRTRLLALWDQSAPYNPQQPNRYGYGRIYRAEEIDRALTAPDPYAALGYDPAVYDTGSGSHGTHTFSISSGNGASGGPIGLAPEASMGFVNLSTYTAEGPTSLGDSVALLEGLDFVARMAGEAPLVVNASLGRQAGEHDGRTLTEQGMDAFLLEASGRAIVQSTGNYFSRRAHACGVLRPGGLMTRRLIIQEGDRTPNEVDLWYPGVDRFQIVLCGPGGTPEVRAGPGERSPIIIEGQEVGRLYHRIGDPNNGDNQVSLFLYRAAPPGEWELVLFGEAVADGRFHAWVERDTGCSRCQAHFALDDTEPASTTGTICNGLHTLAVGAYDAHRAARPLGVFSSRGPTRDGRTKPDIAAPGVQVLAARSRPFAGSLDAPTLTRMSGTSMAAPHVTGTIALMFEAAERPLTIDETRGLLLAQADPPPENLSHIDRLGLGSGYLNTTAAVEAVERTINSRTGEISATPEEANPIERYRPMDASSKDTTGIEVDAPCEAAPSVPEMAEGSEESAAAVVDQSNEGSPESTELDAILSDENDAEASSDKRRRFVASGRPIMRSSPLQVQVPLTGGPAALAMPVGGVRSPLAVTVPLGAMPPVTAPAATTATSVTPPSQTGGSATTLPAPPTVPSGAVAVPQPSPPQASPAATTSPAFDLPLTEPVVAEPPAPEPAAVTPPADEPPVTVASPDFPLYVPPDPGDKGTNREADLDTEARDDRSRVRMAPSPFQIQVPLTGGAPALAVPVGGYGSPVAFSVPLGGVQAAQPAISNLAPVTQPLPSEPPVTVASPDGTLYTPRAEADIAIEDIGEPEAWPQRPYAEHTEANEDRFSEEFQMSFEPSEFSIDSWTESTVGEQVLATAESIAEADSSIPLTSAALLATLVGNTNRPVLEGEGIEESPLNPLGGQGSGPSATALFNAFVHPNHPLLPRNALNRHYARRFRVLAYPGQRLADLELRPGDLMIRVARGEGWGHIAVIASRELHQHDRLGAMGLRGEGFPRLRPGLYVQVIELGHRRFRHSDRFARRVCDDKARVLADTLLLRILPQHGFLQAGESENLTREISESANCPLAEDFDFTEQYAPAAPDSSVANRFIAAHRSRYCTPGQAGSSTCQNLVTPRPIRRVVIHVLAVPSTSRRSGVEAVVAGWQNSGRQASAHYLVDRDGTITQMVRDADVAFHTPGNNADSIGIEHADVCNDPSPLTTQLYEHSAALVRDLALRHGFTPNDTTVRGHSQVNPNHGDPGPYWDWEYYYLLLAWGGLAAASRPIRMVTSAAERGGAPTGWQVQRRRSIPNDRCASRRDPWGATYWRARPDASGAPAELSLVVNETCTYKVSLWWPDVSGANPAVQLEIEVACLSSPCTGASTQTATVNQRPNSGRWNDVAVINPTQTPAEVKIRWLRNASPPGWILVDAVRLLKIATCPGPTSLRGSGDGETEIVTDSSRAGSTPATILHRGDSGTVVREAQRKLNRIHADAVALGLPGLAGCPLVEDSRFGPRMETAVLSFQQQVFGDPIEWDGIIGPKTWAQLELLTGTSISQITSPSNLPASISQFQPTEAVLEPSLAGWDANAEADGVNRNSRDYIRWVQTSLNQITGAKLVVDGLVGPATTAAVRAFQQQRGLTADGVVGPRTEAALIAAGALAPTAALTQPPIVSGTPITCPGPTTVLDRFGHDQSMLTVDHRPIIEQLADQIAASQVSPTPVRAVCLAGHTDNSGDNAYNRALGARRNDSVRKGLKDAVERRAPSLWSRLSVDSISPGEEQPIASNATADGQAHNRRVEVSIIPPVGPNPLEPVRFLQNCLSNLLATPLPITGVFDTNTQNALRIFQQRQGITPAHGLLTLPTVTSLAALCSLKAPKCAAPLTAKDDPSALNLSPVGVVDYDGGTLSASTGRTLKIRGTAFYPSKSDGTAQDFNNGVVSKAPVVFLAHGNHPTVHDPADRTQEFCQGDPSAPPGALAIPNHQGYQYFQEQLARIGLISVSVDCNETNCLGLSKANITERAELIAASIKYFQSLTAGGDRIFGGHIDFDKLGLMGHSRGAEAVLLVPEMTGSRAPAGVTFKGVLSLAPTDKQASSGTPRGFAFMTILPAGDGDVVTNDGAKFYDKAVPSPFKCQVYVEEANHNFFNTEWVNDDPHSGIGLLSKDEHKRILSVYGCAFFRKTLLNHNLDNILLGQETPPSARTDKVQLSCEVANALTVDDFEDGNPNENTLKKKLTKLGFAKADEHPFKQVASGVFNQSFFGDTKGLVLQRSSAKNQFTSPLAHVTDLSGREVWIRVAEIYTGSIPSGATGFKIGVVDTRNTTVLIDSDEAGGLPRPFDRKADDLVRFKRDFTKTMLKTYRFPPKCFSRNSGLDMTKVKAVVIHLNRGDNRALAFDQLQIV